MKDIKIFVSHRIDKDSIPIKNPLFYHMRCGAVYDTRDAPPLMGDDTGDNISDKRLTYNDFTVQYWAWKNVKADYYGLCLYRRYLSFAKKDFPIDPLVHGVRVSHICNKSICQYKLSHVKRMRKVIESHDAVVNKPVDVRTMSSAGVHSQTVGEHWALEFGAWSGHPRIKETKYIDKMMDIIRVKYPKYLFAAEDCLDNIWFRGNNCCILRKDLFFEMCELRYNIMVAIETGFDYSHYPENSTIRRAPAYIGELLYGIFIHYLEIQKRYNIKEVQLIFFDKTEENYLSERTGIMIKGTINRNKIARNQKIKDILLKISPIYRTITRIEERQKQQLQSNTSHNITVPFNTGLTIISGCFANEIHDTHKKSFGEFKNCAINKDIVIVGSGPTLNYYDPISNALHIGLNQSYQYEKIKFDYVFAQDYAFKSDWFNDLVNYDCTKFFGEYYHYPLIERMQIPETMAIKAHARRYFSSFPRQEIFPNIEYFPLMDFCSVVFPALHFALYMNPRRIYLVGCDVSKNGYFNNTIQIDPKLDPSVWYRGYQKVKLFANHFYPDTEIISVNPIGLKGMFHDVYTKAYLKDNPSLMINNTDLL